jgi:predicted transcriptional regulator
MSVNQQASELPPQVARLAKREREIAAVVYGEGACTAKEIEPRIFPPISNGALRSMLVRLVNKGILKRKWGKRGRGQQFIYVPSITSVEVKRRAIQQVSDLYFDGSLLTMMLEVFAALEGEGEIAAARNRILTKGGRPRRRGEELNLAA